MNIGTNMTDGKIRRETIKAIIYHEEQVKMFSNGNTVHDLELQHFHERKIESLTDGEYAEHLYKESVHGEMCKECEKYGADCDCEQ